MNTRYALYKRPLGLAALALLMLLVFALPQLAFAQSTGGQFEIAKDDYFINSIMKGVLGDVISTGSQNAQGSITGSGTLGEVFRTFNLGVAFFGSLMVIFITVVGVLNSGNDGEFLGRKWSSMWVPVRFAAGSALMLPLTSSGYSYCQAMVIWIALQGVGFADTLWTSIVKVVAIKNGYSLTSTYDGNSILRQVAMNRACVELVNGLNAGMTGYLNPGTFGLHKSFSIANGEVKVTYNWGDGGVGAGKSACGQLAFVWAANDDPYNDIRKKIMQTNQTEIELYDKNYTTATQDIVKRLMAGSDSNGNYEIQGEVAKLMTQVSTDAIVYTAKLAEQANTEMAKAGYQTTQKNSQTAMTQYGFAMAGMWYIELLKAHNVARQALQSPNLAGPALLPSHGADVGTKMSILATSFQDNAKAIRSSGYDTQVASPATGAATVPGTTKVTKFNLDAADFATTDAFTTASASVSNFLRESLFGVGPGNSVWTAGSGTGQSAGDPNTSAILQLKDKGDTILDAAGIIMSMHFLGQVGQALATPTGLLESAGHVVADVTSGGWTVAIKKGFAVIDKLSTYFIGAIAALTMLGMTLSIFIPLMPYVIWVGALMGLVILILEGLVAVMIWAVMMMHPSGEGITSQYNKRGMDMMLAIFMRPALLLMGLVLGMFMVEPLIGFVNTTFSFVTESMQSINTFTGLFTIVGTIGIYISLVLTIVEKSFGMIHIVADRVLTWIGGEGALTGAEGETKGRGEAMVRGATTGLSNAVVMKAMGSKTGGPAPTPGNLGGGGGAGGGAGGDGAADGAAAAKPKGGGKTLLGDGLIGAFKK